MTEEQSIKNQIAAMYTWAIDVSENKLNASDYKIAKDLLKKLDYRGRKLEWRGYGIRKLPDMFTKDLKTQISSARASAEKITDILDKKDFEQKKELYLKLCKQYATSMTEMLKRATETVEAEPWEPVNFPLIKKEKWFASLFEQFAKRKGYYKDYPLPKDRFLYKMMDLSETHLQRANLEGANLWGANFLRSNLQGANLKLVNINDGNLEGANLEGANLQRGHFGGVNLEGANLKKADLKEANFFGANFKGANLKEANLGKADLECASFQRANLEGANLFGANFLRADFEEVNLAGVRGLTEEQFSLAKNWQSAQNIPQKLKWWGKG